MHLRAVLHNSPSRLALRTPHLRGAFISRGRRARRTHTKIPSRILFFTHAAEIVGECCEIQISSQSSRPVTWSHASSLRLYAREVQVLVSISDATEAPRLPQEYKRNNAQNESIALFKRTAAVNALK